MSEPIQTFLLAALDKILANSPGIIAAVGAIIIGIRSANKKTEEKANETNKLVVEGKKVTDEVHVMVNGNLTAEKARADVAEAKIKDLEAQLRRRAAKRKTDP